MMQIHEDHEDGKQKRNNVNFFQISIQLIMLKTDNY